MMEKANKQIIPKIGIDPRVPGRIKNYRFKTPSTVSGTPDKCNRSHKDHSWLGERSAPQPSLKYTHCSTKLEFYLSIQIT